MKFFKFSSLLLTLLFITPAIGQEAYDLEEQESIGLVNQATSLHVLLDANDVNQVYMASETDHIPEYGEGCEAVDPTECSNEAINNYLSNEISLDQFNIPIQDQTIFVEFIVDKEGTLGNVVLFDSDTRFSPSFAAAAMEALSEMQDWKPGVKDGHPVNVKMTVPITYKNK